MTVISKCDSFCIIKCDRTDIRKMNICLLDVCLKNYREIWWWILRQDKYLPLFIDNMMNITVLVETNSVDTGQPSKKCGGVIRGNVVIRRIANSIRNLSSQSERAKNTT